MVPAVLAAAPLRCYNAPGLQVSVPACSCLPEAYTPALSAEAERPFMAIDQESNRPPTPLAELVNSPESPGRAAAADGERGGRRRRRGSGCACCLSGVFTLFLVALLVLVGLLLPPVRLIDKVTCSAEAIRDEGVAAGLGSLQDCFLGPQFLSLSAQANAVRAEGLTLQVAAEDLGADFSVAVETLTREQFYAAAPDEEWVAAARSTLPAQLDLRSPVYSLYSAGDAPQRITLDLLLPEEAGSAQNLALYGHDGADWIFLPATQGDTGSLRATVESLPQQLGMFRVNAPAQSLVLITVDVKHALQPEVAQVANIVAPAGIQPTLTGGLTGSLAAGFNRESGYQVMPVVRNFVDARALDTLTVTSILANRALRQTHVNQLNSFASSNFDGLLIDWRDLAAGQRELFSEFIRELAASFADTELKLGVVVPPASVVDGIVDTGAYDWRALGRHADFLQLRLPLHPSNYGADGGAAVELMLRHAVNEVARSRLLAGFDARTLRESSGSLTPVGYAEAHRGLGDVVVEVETTSDGVVLPGTEIGARLDGFRADSGFDSNAMVPWIEYHAAEDAPAARYWLTTGATLRARLERTQPYALAGVGIEGLSAPDQSRDLRHAVLTWKLQQSADAEQGRPTLRWRVEGASGVQSETMTGLGEGLRTTVVAPDGNYAINVDVLTGRDAVPRDGAALGLYAPTPTPTPIPTPTPTPVPRPVVQQPVQQAPAQAPAGGSIRPGSFEYGGHVANAGNAAAHNAMRQSGMTWMKKQARHGITNAVEIIQTGKGAGFKVLIGALGDKSRANDPAYQDEFAGWLAHIARNGADAIEVWNEPNIDREWPAGQINGANFTRLLQKAYAAIKAANPGTMVISGAPAPTGFFGAAGCAAGGCNDDHFLRQMVAAGALNHMDCVGAHHNQGTTAPSARGGSPSLQGYHYSFYYPALLDTYWGAVNGSKPICFTELGYLSGEGYGGLPGGFAWASHVSVQQQAAWLAENIALASQSGRVRLLIVWNVDFTHWSADPQAGYAMIRRDGSCPACGAIAAAR